MTEIQYQSSFASWLGWKLGFFLILLFTIDFISSIPGGTRFVILPLLILLLFLPYSLLVAQVILTYEGVRYRRFLRWKSAGWDQFDSVECPRRYPWDVIVLRLKELQFPLNQIWFYPGVGWRFPKPDLSETLPFKFAAQAIEQARSRERTPPGKYAPLSGGVRTFQIFLFLACIGLGLLFKVKGAYLQAKSVEPTSLIVKMGDTLFNPGILFGAFICAVGLYAVMRRCAESWPESKGKTFVLCLATTPQIALFAIAVLWLLP